MIIVEQDQAHMGRGGGTCWWAAGNRTRRAEEKTRAWKPNSPSRRAFLHIQLHLLGAVSCSDNEILNYISLCDGASVSGGQRIIPGRCVVAEEAGN